MVPRLKNPARYARMGKAKRAHRNLQKKSGPPLAGPARAWSPRVIQNVSARLGVSAHYPSDSGGAIRPMQFQIVKCHAGLLCGLL